MVSDKTEYGYEYVKVHYYEMYNVEQGQWSLKDVEFIAPRDDIVVKLSAATIVKRGRRVLYSFEVCCT